MARTSNGVSFFLKNKSAETSPIKVVFCYNSLQFYYYEKKLSIPVKFWNSKSQRAKETRAFEGYAEFNASLNNIESAILECYRKFKNDFSREPTIDELRILVKERRGFLKKTPVKKIDLITFIRLFINDAKSGKYVNQSRGTAIAKVTINTYEQTLNLLIAFASFKNSPVDFGDIDSSFHKEFNYFLSKVYVSRDTNSSLKINTIGKHFTNIKTFMSIALERGFTANEGFRTKSFKVVREDVESIALTEQEINALEQIDLANEKRLEKVRDMFLIGCDTALRISDLKRLRKENLFDDAGRLYFKIEMRKTGKSVVIPVTERVKSIIEKYENATGDLFPKAISDQKANDYIKEIAMRIPLLCEIVEINQTIDGHRRSKQTPKYDLITNHTSRRSFATNWALKGISSSVIMKITGHKTEKSFTRYIKINEIQGAKLFEMQVEKLSSPRLV